MNFLLRAVRGAFVFVLPHPAAPAPSALLRPSVKACGGLGSALTPTELQAVIDQRQRCAVTPRHQAGR